MSQPDHSVIIDGEAVVLPISGCRLAHVDRKWPGRHMYCSKHNYGPMDSWYNCEECSNEVGDEFELHQQSDEYKEGWQLIRTGKYAEGKQKIICPSRREVLRYYKMSTILKKIPRESAEQWMATFM